MKKYFIPDLFYLTLFACALLRLSVHAAGNPSDSLNPFEPQRPFPYQEREVTFAGAQDGVTLAGTLTLPKGKGPFPAVLLVAGSGPNDRDENYYDRHPFLVVRSEERRVGKECRS